MEAPISSLQGTVDPSGGGIDATGSIQRMTEPEHGQSAGAWQIAQLNIGRAVAPLEDAAMAGFMSRLDEVNALAERSPGFVWRLQGAGGNTTDLKVTADPQFIINLSVWDTIDDLSDFTYRSGHKGLFAQRFEWFERAPGPSLVLWWQPAGSIPSITEALSRLQLLADHGPTARAFTFKRWFPAPAGPAG
jgi:hypothetical protein